MVLNERGQEFSVFKLLISAIVAIVVLTLLLNILGIIDFNPNTDPAEAAKNLLTSMDSSVYQEKVSDRLDFSSENSINNAALAEATGISSDQICLLRDSDLPGDFTATGKRISKTGANSVRVKLAGICARYENFQDSSYEDYAPELEKTTFEGNLNTLCFEGLSEGEKACLLVLIKSNE